MKWIGAAYLVFLGVKLWRAGAAFVQRASGEEISVETGLADATRIEIVSGLAAGDEVRLP